MQTLIRALVGTVMLVGLAACAEDANEGSPSGAAPAVSPPAATEEEITIEDAQFSVEELTIASGTTVTWTNRDDVGHTVTHGEEGAPVQGAVFNEAISVDQVVSYTFEEPGTYPVTCTIHPEMQMTVIVED